MKHMSEEQLYITPKQAAEILGVHVKSVKKMIRDGTLRAKNINPLGKRKMYRILKEDVIKSDKSE